MCLFHQENEGVPLLLYGLQNGNFGAIELSEDDSILLWEYDSHIEGNRAPITHIKVAELKENQSPSIILVRDDSSIEIYKF